MRALIILAVLAAPAARAQSAARTSQPSSSAIVVGPNVQVSKSFSKLAHYENLAAGDPDHAGRLLACATVAHEDMASQGYHCYVSFDGGKAWSSVLEFDEGPRNSDPAMTYGRGDTVFVVNEYTPGGNQSRMEIYRSADGGKTWSRSATFPWIDRQAVVVDKTDGRYAGRTYISGVSKGYYGA